MVFGGYNYKRGLTSEGGPTMQKDVVFLHGINEDGRSYRDGFKRGFLYGAWISTCIFSIMIGCWMVIG